jgi:hypothetical protein
MSAQLGISKWYGINGQWLYRWGGRNPATPVLGQETDSYPVQMESTFSNIYVLSLGREPTGDFE